MAGSLYSWSLTPGDNDDADGDINWLENQFPDSVNDSARQMMGRIAEWRDDIAGALSAGGTANTRTLTARSAFASLANGRMVTFRSGLANTGATTLNVNGLGSRAIRKMGLTGDVDLSAGDLLVGGVYVAIYSASANSNAGGWLLMAPYTNDFAQISASGATIGNAGYGSYSAAPISSLVPGTTLGSLIEGWNAGHLVLGIRDNDANDSVSVVSFNGTGNYSKLVAAFRANGAAILDAVAASSLAVSGATTFNGAATFNAASTLGGNKVDAFPAGTRMLFQQTAAPTGWTKDTSIDDRALRVVSGSASLGGAVAFSAVFSSARSTTNATQSGTVGNTTLTVAQMPNHAHGPGNLAGTAASAGTHTHGPGTLAGVTNSAGNHTHPNLGNGYLYNTTGSSTSTTGGTNTDYGSIPAAGAHTHAVDVNAGATAGGGAHTHTVGINSGTTSSAGSGNSHTHTFTGEPHSHTTNLQVQYVDVIICEKAA
ncbi:hypothetical protein MesoLjLc_22170 [Mesorhizobium sp. L-8-10]|uniref:hypothetical protein n=1 Tax=Mesorhizobium sp. L-8-10 TaxID=2744523 RepID=UPI0019264EAF|nr:hypothetical protein [Mesorhizobium sp. L-8-10]BCH30287.1 hypothetical protein MesoLjLc_22170 [Mesorhizobium sp. L-8-10]